MNKEDDLLKITSLAWSFVPFNTIRFSVEEELFSLVHERRLTVEAVAEKKGWKLRPTKALIHLLASLNFVTVENGVVALTGLSRKFLLPCSDFYIGDFYTRNALLEKAYSSLGELMVNDVPNPGMNARVKASFGLTGMDHSAIQEFGKAMVAASKIILSDFVNEYPIDQNATILDIGAGLGALEEVLFKSHKGRIVALETPEVAHAAEIKFTESSNTVFQKENWHSWEPKEKYDVVFLNHVLHEEKLDGARELFRKASASVNDNGELVVISFMAKEGEGLQTAAVFQMNLLLEMGSDLPSLDWVRKEAEAVGFKEEALLKLPGGRVAWVGVHEGSN